METPSRRDGTGKRLLEAADKNTHGALGWPENGRVGGDKRGGYTGVGVVMDSERYGIMH